MSGKFSAETRVANCLRHYLLSAGMLVIQLVQPGGQCLYSITYESIEGKRKTIFPDVLLFDSLNARIVLGEMKPKFSKDDYNKLIEINQSKNGLDAVRRLVANVAGVGSDALVGLVLIHAQLEALPVEMVSQWIVSPDGIKILPPII